MLSPLEVARFTLLGRVAMHAGSNFEVTRRIIVMRCRGSLYVVHLSCSLLLTQGENESLSFGLHDPADTQRNRLWFRKSNAGQGRRLFAFTPAQLARRRRWPRQ